MYVSFVIVHYKNPALLKLCMRSIKATVKDLDYEVIVVDSESNRVSRDTAREEGKRFANFELLTFEYNTGFSVGVNRGIAKSTGRYVMILNPDTILTDGAITKLVTYADQHKDIGILGPRLLYFNGEPQQSYFRFYKPGTIFARRLPLLKKFSHFKKLLTDHVMSETDPKLIQAPDWILGAAMFVRREAIDTVGLMDERFFLYFEDVDWCRRFWHNGYKVIYYPSAVLYHYYPRESRSRLGFLDALFNKKTRWHISSAIKFFWKFRDLSVTRS